MTLSWVMLAAVKRIERIRLYPTARQAAALAVMLDVTRELYNALLQQRRDAYRLRKVTVTTKMQYADLTALRAEDGRLRAVYREAEDAVLHRLDLAMAAFFRRCRRGEAPGYPRFKSWRRWEQFGVPARRSRSTLRPTPAAGEHSRRWSRQAAQGPSGSSDLRACMAGAQERSLVCLL
jgi:transposase